MEVTRLIETYALERAEHDNCVELQQRNFTQQSSVALQMRILLSIVSMKRTDIFRLLR
jgi:hypothetical protein